LIKEDKSQSPTSMLRDNISRSVKQRSLVDVN